MKTFRKTVAGLVMALAVVFGYAALPGTAQANDEPEPDIGGLWDTNYGPALFVQLDDGVVGAVMDGPFGHVEFEGSFTGPRRLLLTVNGVQRDGIARLWVLPGDQKMRGLIKLDNIWIPFRWKLSKQ